MVLINSSSGIYRLEYRGEYINWVGLGCLRCQCRLFYLNKEEVICLLCNSQRKLYKYKYRLIEIYPDSNIAKFIRGLYE